VNSLWSDDTAERIAALFRQFCDEDDGGNLLAPTVEYPYQLINVRKEARKIVYSTKPRSAFRVFEKQIAAGHLALLGRYGLPDKQDVDGILQVINGRECVFIGDADPQDVLVFAWLRTHVHLNWIGVSDVFLELMRTCLTNDITIELSRVEREVARQVPLFCPDFKDFLGPNCGALFDAGKKLELEGAMNLATIGEEQYIGP